MSEQLDALAGLTEARLDRLTEIAHTEAPKWFSADAADGYLIAMDKIQAFIEWITNA